MGQSWRIKLEREEINTLSSFGHCDGQVANMFQNTFKKNVAGKESGRKMLSRPGQCPSHVLGTGRGLSWLPRGLNGGGMILFHSPSKQLSNDTIYTVCPALLVEICVSECLGRVSAHPMC